MARSAFRVGEQGDFDFGNNEFTETTLVKAQELTFNFFVNFYRYNKRALVCDSITFSNYSVNALRKIKRSSLDDRFNFFLNLCFFV